MDKLRVLSVDDHPIVRDGLRWMLGEDGDVEVVAEADDIAGAFDAILSSEPDVVMLDIDLGGKSSFAGLEEMRTRFPDIPVVILTMSDDPDHVEAAVRAGASGYLVKNAPRDELLRAVRAAAAGKAYIQSEVTRPLLMSFAREVRGRGNAPALSRREGDVIALAAGGLANKQIATRLGISEPTVKDYLRHVYEKLGAADRAQAVAIALRNRLID